MRQLDTDNLRAFIAVVDMGSFTAAAAHLNKTQAAISFAIARLENQIGKRLFNRTSRRVTMTSAGELLIVYARRMMKLEAEAFDAVLGPKEDGRVRLGMPDDYISYFGEALIHKFSPQYKKVYIDFECEFSRNLETMVENRELDVAIITQDPLKPKGTVFRQEKQFWCTGPNGFPEREPELQLALFSEECPARPGVFTLLQQAGIQWNLVYSSTHLTGVLLAAASGRLVTVLPEPAIPAGWRKLGAAEGLPELPPLPLALMISKNERLPARQVAAFLMREFSQMAADPDLCILGIA